MLKGHALREEDSEDFDYKATCPCCSEVVFSHHPVEICCIGRIRRPGDFTGPILRHHKMTPMDVYKLTTPDEQIALAFFGGGNEEESNDHIILAWELLGKPESFHGHDDAEGMLFTHRGDHLLVMQDGEVFLGIPLLRESWELSDDEEIVSLN